jgi:hypothetical protein
VHAFLVLVVASRDTLWLVGRGATILPASTKPFGQACESLLGLITEGPVGKVGSTNFVRSYLHLTGIESGYSYFAPNVGDSYKLVFELQHPDGRMDYDSFTPETREGNLRLDGLLDQVVKTRSDALRELVMRLLTESAWQRYPEVVHVRAVLAALKFPEPNEYRNGRRPSYDFLFAYDFSPAEGSDQ